MLSVEPLITKIAMKTIFLMNLFWFIDKQLWWWLQNRAFQYFAEYISWNKDTLYILYEYVCDKNNLRKLFCCVIWSIIMVSCESIICYVCEKENGNHTSRCDSR